MKPLLSLPLILMIACQPSTRESNDAVLVRLITLDPGHFHAALVQKSMYGGVDSTVHVYAPQGIDVQLHLDKISVYNQRAEQPTHWNEVVYTGPDFFEKMLKEKAGNMVVLAGNNQKKTEYILKSLQNGLNVLADKPMVINADGFKILLQAFDEAKKNDLLLYDIMTERYEITTILQRELSMIPEIFGTLQKGSSEDPAVTKESVHHFFKYVSGNVLTRPAWFMDVSQQGEGIVDVTTHLVDLVQWECFPEETLDYLKDIQITNAKRWTTDITLSEFKAITKLDSFPDYLRNSIVNDSILKVYSNGEINYQLRGVNAKVSVTWAYKAPEGGGDRHYSIMRGSKSTLVIRQGAEQQFKPTLYIEPVDASIREEVLLREFEKIKSRHDGINLVKNGKGWEVAIPQSLREGHEAHFARVTQTFLKYLKERNMPSWEIPNMIARYYTTTQALELAMSKQP